MSQRPLATSDPHERFHYSITCHTDDQAVLFCLRALCRFSEQSPMAHIGWGGTKTAAWRRAEGQLKLRFTSPDYRERFADEAGRLLPGRWSELARSDADPATRRRAR